MTGGAASPFRKTPRGATLCHMEGMPDEQRAAIPESADEELARLRRLAIVDELLTTLVGVLDVREVFAQVSEVAGRVLTHDAIALPVITEDRQHVIPFATAGPAAVAYPGTHPIPETARYLLTDPWEFEIVDDLQSDPDRERHSASLGYRSMLRVPIRLKDEVIALVVVLSRTPAVYRPTDAVIARRVADAQKSDLRVELRPGQIESWSDLGRVIGKPDSIFQRVSGLKAAARRRPIANPIPGQRKICAGRREADRTA